MRNRQPGLVKNDIAKQQQIEIENAGRARKRSRASACLLDIEEQGEEICCAQRGLADGCGVQKQGLNIGNVDRDGFVDGRQTKVRQGRRQSIAGERQMSLTIAEIGTQADGDEGGAIQSTAWPALFQRERRRLRYGGPASPFVRRAPARRTASAPASRQE